MGGILDDWEYYAGPHLSKGLRNIYNTGAGLFSLLSPGADVRDAVQSSQSASQNFQQGNIGRGLLDTAYIPASLLAMAIPGSIGGAKKMANAYHGTTDDIRKIDLSKTGANTGDPDTRVGGVFFASERPELASFFAENATPAAIMETDQGKALDYFRDLAGKKLRRAIRNGDRHEQMQAWESLAEINDMLQEAGDISRREAGPNVMPLKIDHDGFREIDLKGDSFDGPTWAAIIKKAKDEGLPGVTFRNQGPEYETTYAIFEPKRVRSRFAKFDPTKKDSTDILAGVGGGLLSAEVYRELRSDKKDER